MTLQQNNEKCSDEGDINVLIVTATATAVTVGSHIDGDDVALGTPCYTLSGRECDLPLPPPVVAPIPSAPTEPIPSRVGVDHEITVAPAYATPATDSYHQQQQQHSYPSPIGAAETTGTTEEVSRRIDRQSRQQRKCRCIIAVVTVGLLVTVVATALSLSKRLGNDESGNTDNNSVGLVSNNSHNSNNTAPPTESPTTPLPTPSPSPAPSPLPTRKPTMHPTTRKPTNPFDCRINTYITDPAYDANNPYHGYYDAAGCGDGSCYQYCRWVGYNANVDPARGTKPDPVWSGALTGGQWACKFGSIETKYYDGEPFLAPRCPGGAGTPAVAP